MFTTSFKRGAQKCSKLALTCPQVRLATNNISQELSSTQLLTGTGQGPFIELPVFKPIGALHNLLNVKMPERSNLCVTSGSIIAMNGDLSGLSAVPRVLDTTNYQILQSESSVSLIFGGKSRSNTANNFVVLEINKKDDVWTIFNNKSVVAWTGYDFSLFPVALFGRQHSLETRGKGFVAINEMNKVLEITLGENEKFWAKPTNVVATNASFEYKVLRNDSRLPTMTLPRLAMPNWISRYWKRITDYTSKQWRRGIEAIGAQDQAEGVARIFERIGLLYRNTVLFLKINLVNRVFKKQIMMEFTGPSRLVVNVSGQDGNTVFSKKEMQQIFDTRF